MQALIRAQAVVRSQRARRFLNKDNRFHPEIRHRKSIVRPNSSQMVVLSTWFWKLN